MNSNDRKDFDGLMRKLCIGLGALPAPDRLQTYWECLQKMTLIQFTRVVDSCLDEKDGVGKLPSVPAIWKIWHGIRDKSRARTPAQAEILAPRPTKEQEMLYSMLLRYIQRRRLREGFTGDINMAARQAACRRLVNEITAANITDWDTDLSSVDAMFQSAMQAIPDGVAA